MPQLQTLTLSILIKDYVHIGGDAGDAASLSEGIQEYNSLEHDSTFNIYFLITFFQLCVYYVVSGEPTINTNKSVPDPNRNSSKSHRRSSLKTSNNWPRPLSVWSLTLHCSVIRSIWNWLRWVFRVFFNLHASMFQKHFPFHLQQNDPKRLSVIVKFNTFYLHCVSSVVDVYSGNSFRGHCHIIQKLAATKKTVKTVNTSVQVHIQEAYSTLNKIVDNLFAFTQFAEVHLSMLRFRVYFFSLIAIFDHRLYSTI